MANRLMLSIPEKLFAHIKKRESLYAYASTQEVIVAVLRKEFMEHADKDRTGSKRGRPRKLDELAILSRKNIFSSKHGVPIDI